MDANKVLREIIDASKPLTITEASKESFIKDCEKCGVKIDSNYNILSSVTEDHIDKLIDNLNNVVLKMVVRKILRNYTWQMMIKYWQF